MPNLRNLPKETIQEIIHDVKEQAATLERLYKKGVPVDKIVESTDMPIELIAVLTDIPIEKKEYIVPVQVITEGYVKVKAISIDDAVASVSAGLDNIKFETDKLSVDLSDSDGIAARVVDDGDIVQAYTKAGESFAKNQKFLDSDIKSITDFSKNNINAAIYTYLTGEYPDCNSCCCCCGDDDAEDDTEMYDGDIDYYTGDDLTD
jgi:hypothetical protein